MSVLGPQCLRCRKRRVKCDSKKPTCVRCPDDGYDCPGYTRPLIWIVDKQSSRVKSGNAKDFLQKKAPVQSSDSSQDEGEDVACSSYLPVDRVLGMNDNVLTYLETIEFYNAHISPVVSPVQKSVSIDGRSWIEVPQFLQNLLVVLVSFSKALQFGCQTEQELYKHRGLALRGLKDNLETTNWEEEGFVLLEALCLLYQEAILSPLGGFEVHLRAARQMVALLGGIEACIRIMPPCSSKLGALTIVEVLTTVNSRIDRIKLKTVKDQFEDVRHISNMEQTLLCSRFPCPMPLFKALIGANYFRAMSHDGQWPLDTWKTQFLRKLAEIQSFQPAEWANNIQYLTWMQDDGYSMGPLDEWILLGSCFQASVVVYLIQSTYSQTDKFYKTDLSSTALPALALARHQLHDGLAKLLPRYPPDSLGLEGSRLWRFLIWPIFIHVFDALILSNGSSHGEQVLNKCFPEGGESLSAQLRQAGSVLASHGLFEAAGWMERLLEIKSVWTWDEAFRGGSICII